MATEEYQRRVDPELMKRGGEFPSSNCRKCGTIIHFGEAICSHCSTNTEVGVNSMRYNLLLNAAEFSPPLPTGDTGWELDKVAEQMQKALKETDKSLYYMWKGIPLCLGPGVDAKEALNMWGSAKKAGEREEMQDKWTDALGKFHNLQTQLEELGMEKRQEVGNAFVDSFDSPRVGPQAQGFFVQPDFSNVEPILDIFPTSDDAAALKKAIDRISQFLPHEKAE